MMAISVCYPLLEKKIAVDARLFPVGNRQRAHFVLSIWQPSVFSTNIRDLREWICPRASLYRGLGNAAGSCLPSGREVVMEIIRVGFGSSRWQRRVISGSTYLRTGAPQRCALCNAPFGVEEEHLQCWTGTDQRYYCCRNHAGLGLEKLRAPGRWPVALKQRDS
jgi:hypothetical protein